MVCHSTDRHTVKSNPRYFEKEQDHYATAELVPKKHRNNKYHHSNKGAIKGQQLRAIVTPTVVAPS